MSFVNELIVVKEKKIVKNFVSLGLLLLRKDLDWPKSIKRF